MADPIIKIISLEVETDQKRIFHFRYSYLDPPHWIHPKESPFLI